MPKPIDFDYIRGLMEENPDDWYTPDEAAKRLDAMLQKALGVPGPKISVVDWSAGGFRIEIDFDTIEQRGAGQR